MPKGWNAGRVLSCLTLVIVTAPHAWGTDYYVNRDGHNNYPGTSPLRAWRTLDRLTAHDFEPGDTVHLEAGAAFDGGIRLDPGDAGAPGSPVTLTSYGTGRATIRTTSGSGLFVEGCGHIHVRDLIFEGPGREDPAGWHGIRFYTASPNGEQYEGIVVENVEVSGFYWHGIEIISDHSSDPGFRDVRILDCEVHDNGMAGIISSGVFQVDTVAHYAHEQILVEGCRVYDNTGHAGLSSHSGSGILLSFVDGAVIQYCEAWGNGALNEHCGGPIGIWAWEANDVVIQFNEAHHNSAGTGCDGGGFDLDGGVTNRVMQYNYSHDNDGAGYGIFQFDWAHPFHDNVVRYNISENDGRNRGASIHFWATDSNGGIQRTQVYGNTFYVGPDSTGAAVQDIGGSLVSGTQIYNNIFVTAPGKRVVDIVDIDSYTFKGNAYYTYGGSLEIRWSRGIYTSLDEWRSSSGQETHASLPVGMEIDPLLTDPGNGGTIGDPRDLASLTAYLLQPGSPVINRGLDLAVEFGIDPGPRDFWGNPLPAGAGLDIGAHEYTIAPPHPAGRVPDGAEVPGTPLMLARTGAPGEIVMTWDDSCVPEDDDYEIYEGALGDFTDHAPLRCSTGGATAWAGPVAPGSTWFVVAPRSDNREGSYGADSSGAQRPPSAAACLPQEIAPCP
jgi:hypothetical protein